MNVEGFIDNWVEKINLSARRRNWDFYVPPSVQSGPPDQYEEYDWQIRKFQNINWIDTVEEELPCPFPPSFRALVTRYIFPSIESEKAWLFANTPEGIDRLYELRTGIFEDKFLSQFLLERGFIQCGRAHEGNYDPLCFDTNVKPKRDEFPVVQIDHEDILCRSKLRIVREIAPSFRHLIETWFDS